ncbi:MAG: hypothetical protein HOE90_10660 [Bacteriovoracaceae bacterium]|jgi:hypothetical protein|nr:hypothetical protein [Bacteriovoracaceae bacterium]
MFSTRILLISVFFSMLPPKAYSINDGPAADKLAEHNGEWIDDYVTARKDEIALHNSQIKAIDDHIISTALEQGLFQMSDSSEDFGVRIERSAPGMLGFAEKAKEDMLWSVFNAGINLLGIDYFNESISLVITRGGSEVVLWPCHRMISQGPGLPYKDTTYNRFTLDCSSASGKGGEQFWDYTNCRDKLKTFLEESGRKNIDTTSGAFLTCLKFTDKYEQPVTINDSEIEDSSREGVSADGAGSGTPE